jgi:hypothetical protein
MATLAKRFIALGKQVEMSKPLFHHQFMRIFVAATFLVGHIRQLCLSLSGGNLLGTMESTYAWHFGLHGDW